MKRDARLIVALDFTTPGESLSLVDALGDSVGTYKVGLQLFTAAGPEVIGELVRRDKRVFLDLKLHEIPNSVAGATRAAGDLGVSMLTVHASGGSAMMRAAVEAASETPGMQILALTVVTSLGDADLRELGISRSCEEQAKLLASLAKKSGCHGVVASPREAAMLRARLGDGMHIVTPGIRLEGRDVHDQVRVASPAGAIQAGATHLIVGRAITQAGNPVEVARAVLAQISGHP